MYLVYSIHSSNNKTLSLYRTFDPENNLSPQLRTPITEDTLVWLERSTGKFVKSMGAGLYVFNFLQKIIN